MSNHRPTAPPTPVNHALIELSRYLTPHRFRKNERKVSTAIDFKDVHRSIAQRQFEYLDQPRANYVQARGAWYRELAPQYASGLGAANMEARINFMEIALRRLRQHAEFYGAPIFLVTICPRRYVCPIEIASQIELPSLRQTTRQALAGCSFIGMIEFGLLKCWGRDGIPELNNHVSPHTHNLVFGSTLDEIENAIAAMGPDFKDITRRRAANVLEITPRQLDGYLRYILKAPVSEYQVRTGQRVWHNAETDERVLLPKLNPHPLRPCDQLRMAAVTHQMFLDELLFGQGECTALVREIFSEARQPIRLFNEAAARRGAKPDRFIPIVRGISAKSRLPLSRLIAAPQRRIRPSDHFRTLDLRPRRKPTALLSLNDLSDLNG